MKTINLNHICKIEGHAHLALKIENNKVKLCELKAAEGARFFESLVLGKNIQDIQEIVSRICGICSVAHSVACVQALEEALGMKPSEMQKTIREVLMIGERIRSHATHLYFLALPDYLGYSSALEMGRKYQSRIADALKLITLGNKIIEEFAGREIHPFLKIKEDKPEINSEILIKHLEESKPVIKRTIKLFRSLKHPDLVRETDYLSLSDKEYATLSGKIESANGLFIDDDYKKHLTENIKEYATSKFALKNDNPYQVGAIARLNNNYQELDLETKKELKGIFFPLKNPFENNLAQAAELIVLTNHLIPLLKRLGEMKPEKTDLKIRAGRGVSAVEAPRGTLFHEYEIDNDGKITYCNIITPTVQNLNRMEQDIILLVNQDLAQSKPKEQIVLDIEKLIRSYDPCFSCSTHFLRVKWM